MRMMNRFVYSCQKLKLAVGLARFDLLFLLDGLSSFKDVITPARFFVKPSAEPFSRRLESFLAVPRNACLTVLLSELAALAPESSAPLFLSEKTEHFPSGPVVLRKKSDCDSFFCRRLFRELASGDFAAWPDAAAAFNKRLLLASDMRLYASEQEALTNVSADSEAFWALPTDWLKTSAGQWIADSPRDFVLTADLTPEAGKNLVRLFAKMLFVRKIVVAGWNRLAVDTKGRVAFAGVDAVFPASCEHRLFALGRGKVPRDFAGLKLCRAIGELKSYCPASEIENIFADYAGTVEPEKTFLAPGEKFVSQMNLLGFKTGRLSAVEKKSPNFWPRYLDKKRSEAPAGTFKTSILYWGPALIAALILFMLFRF